MGIFRKIFKTQKPRYFLSLRTFDPITLVGCMLDLETNELVSWEHTIITDSSGKRYKDGNVKINESALNQARITFPNKYGITYWPLQGMVETMGIRDRELKVNIEGNVMIVNPEKAVELIKTYKDSLKYTLINGKDVLIFPSPEDERKVP